MSGESFSARVADLTAGISGANKLNGFSVEHHGGVGDTITLGSEYDWLFWRMIGAGADMLTEHSQTLAYSTYI
jgi:hypothetical protein